MKKVLAIALALAMALMVVPFSIPSLQAEASNQSSQCQEMVQEPNLIVVKEGGNFEISLSQAITYPFVEWICDGFDEEYISLLDTYYEPPEGGIVGVTNKVFLFEALKAGVTEIQFGYYELDDSGNPIELIKSEAYKVRIIEKAPYPRPFIKPLKVEVVEHSSGCFCFKLEPALTPVQPSPISPEPVPIPIEPIPIVREGTTAVWDNGDILATTIVKTPVPCYDLQFVGAIRIGDDIVVRIVFQQQEGICIQCVGMQKVVYRIHSPGVDVINLKVDIKIDDQKVRQSYVTSQYESVISLPFANITGRLKSNLTSSMNTRVSILTEDQGVTLWHQGDCFLLKGR